MTEVWKHCLRLGVHLPQKEPIITSSIGKARARIHDDIFHDFHRAILAHEHQWHGHRTFAIDGSQRNLPRTLLNNGDPQLTPKASYPQGLLSCLYWLDNQMLVDFERTADFNERTADRNHLQVLTPVMLWSSTEGTSPTRFSL